MSHLMYSIQIDQPTAIAWGLNSQQAMVFALIHQLPTWADSVQIEGNTWYHLSKGKLISELPLLTDKPDTAWRYLRQLVGAGVIETMPIGNRTHVRVTKKGKAWNRTKDGEFSEGRKNFRPSEKNHLMYSIQIDQPTGIDWGLNCQQAMVFALIHQLPTWADSAQIEGDTWYHLSKGKLISELPLLTDKPDTAWRYLKQLVGLGVIETMAIGNKTHVRVTEQGKAWNRVKHADTTQGRKNIRPWEENPTPGKISEGRKNIQPSEKNPARVGKISEPGSEKNPTDEYYQDHNYQDQNICADLAEARPAPAADSNPPDPAVSDPTQSLNGELVDDDVEIVPGWTFARLIDPPEQDPEAGTYIALPLRSDQHPPVHFVTERDVLNLGQAYRGIDVADELRVMLGWSVGNPAKRKTAAGIRKFISSWLGRAKASGGSPYRQNTTHLTGFEKAGADAKTKRQRVREALRDIHDTNW